MIRLSRLWRNREQQHCAGNVYRLEACGVGMHSPLNRLVSKAEACEFSGLVCG